jgi:glycosyltransferase involved in cell wall biosynthesis
MKVLILQEDFPPQSFGGAGFSVFDLAGGLYRAGHEVFVITTCQDKSKEEIADYQGLKVFRIFAHYPNGWRAYLSLYNPQTIKRVRELIKEINPDVIHAHNIHFYLSYHCLKIAKKAGKALFWTARDVMSFNYGKLATRKYLEKLNCRTNWLDHLKEAGKRYNPLRNLIIRKYLSYADQKFAVSQALQEALEQNGIKNVEVIHTGIDVKNWAVSDEAIASFKKEHNLAGKKIVFFGGRISWLKGAEQIKQAMALVKKEIPEAILLTAGEGDVGWLSGEALKAAYCCADIVAVPSICFDSLPRSVLEAMACKKPVIATLFGGAKEAVQDSVTGYIVNPLETELMAQKIIDLLKNPEKARQFGEAGFARVREHFNLDGQVAQTINWYKKILSAKKI